MTLTISLLAVIILHSLFDLVVVRKLRREIASLGNTNRELMDLNRERHEFMCHAIPEAYERGWRERGAFSAPIVYGGTVLKEKSN